MKIFCIAANYRKHNEELNFENSSTPIFFIKPETSLLRNNSDFYYPEFSKQIEESEKDIADLDEKIANYAKKYHANSKDSEKEDEIEQNRKDKIPVKDRSVVDMGRIFTLYQSRTQASVDEDA